MNNKRFGNDERLNYIYNVLNEGKFRNYIYDYDERDNYCNYIDEYECAIDNRDDKIAELEQTLNKIEKYMTNYIKVEDDNENVKVEFNELLKIIQRARGE